MCASLAQHHAGAHLRGIPLAHCTFKPPTSRHAFSRRAGVCPRCFSERPCAAPSRMRAHMFFVMTFLCATSRHHRTISNRPPAPARPQKCVGVISRSFDALRRPSRVCSCPRMLYRAAPCPLHLLSALQPALSSTDPCALAICARDGHGQLHHLRCPSPQRTRV